MVYIYALFCPEMEAIRYIGKSSNPEARLQGHISKAKSGKSRHHTSNWIRRLLSCGKRPALIILQVVEDGDSWQEAEREWISFALSLGWPITNSTKGGEGLSFLSEEARQNYSRTMSRAITASYRDSPELRDVASRNAIRLWSDPEWSSRQREILSSEAVRLKMSLSAKIAGNDNKKSEQRIRTMRSPEHRALRSEIAKSTNNYPGVKESISKAVKSHWADPLARARHCEALRAAWAKRKERANAG